MLNSSEIRKQELIREIKAITWEDNEGTKVDYKRYVYLYQINEEIANLKCMSVLISCLRLGSKRQMKFHYRLYVKF